MGAKSIVVEALLVFSSLNVVESLSLRDVLALLKGSSVGSSCSDMSVPASDSILFNGRCGSMSVNDTWKTASAISSECDVGEGVG